MPVSAAVPLMPTSAFTWLVRGMLWMVGIGLLVLLIVSGLTVPLDNALYDLHARYWRYTPDDRVVIVAIDAKSLDEVGRFPWPRSVHAQLIDRLTADGVRGIGMDVTMSTPSSDPKDDQLVATAMHRNGKVVLPAFAEAVNLGGPLQEALPVQTIAQSVAALGQVDVAKDNDERVRGAYLKAGLGSAYWPSLALALLQLGHDAPNTLPGLHDPLHNDASPYLWMRDNYVLLRYAGPQGTFGSLSYADVLNNRVPASLLKDRWVLVGATAQGLGDILQTPDSPMPGVEYQANVLESLERGLLVTPLDFLRQLALSAVLLALPLLLYGLPGIGRNNWTLLFTSMLLVVAACFALLRGAYLWWPPASCLVVLAIEFVAWQLLMRNRRSTRAP